MDWLERWARTAVKHHRLLLVVWGVLVVMAGAVAGRLEGRLQPGTGDLPGSPSDRTAHVIRTRFANPYTQSMVVVLDARGEASRTREVVHDLAAALRALPEVREVTLPGDTGSPPGLVSPEHHRQVLLVGLGAVSRREAERVVERLRTAIAPVVSGGRQTDPTLEVLVTGQHALTVDLDRFGTEDSTTAENRAFPLTAIAMGLAFGTLVAVLTPLLMGVVAIVLAAAVLWALSHALDITVFAQSIGSMLGLALGIDYALLVVSRFREGLRDGLAVEEAVVGAVRTAGHAVLVSGGMVAIGFVGLGLTPILDTRSIGAGGVAVVGASVAIALGWLPAWLAFLGPRIDAPRWLRLPTFADQTERLRQLGSRLVARPWPSAALSLGILVLLAAPLTTVKLGFPLGRWMPARMESSRGLDRLTEMGLGATLFPVNLVFTAREGKALDATHLGALMQTSRTLHADPRVARVLGPVDLQAGLSSLAYRLLYRDVEAALSRYPRIGAYFVSTDRRSVAFQVLLSERMTFEDTKAFATDVARLEAPGFRLDVGGHAAFFNDFERAMTRTYGPVVGFVLGSTFLLMALTYRSLLVPLKAVLLNLLAVAAGMGAVVALFQWGWGAGWLGLEAGTGAIPHIVPPLLFCVMFGLSMDYEVFMLSRIREGLKQGLSGEASLVEGLARTGGLITSAAVIMVCVFGAFAFSRVVMIQMVGVGLAVAVLADATLIRVGLVPALMKAAGDWNWWPGNRVGSRGERP